MPHYILVFDDMDGWRAKHHALELHEKTVIVPDVHFWPSAMRALTKSRLSPGEDPDA